MSGLLPCGPPWGGTIGTRGMFGLSRLANFPVHALLYGFQYMRRSVLRVGHTVLTFDFK